MPAKHLNIGALNPKMLSWDAEDKLKGLRIGSIRLTAAHPEELIDLERSTPAFDGIRPGDMVTILHPAGKGMRGQEWSLASGRAVICGQKSNGVVALNMGGPHGTPGCATVRNLVQVKKPGRKKPEIEGPRFGNKT